MENPNNDAAPLAGGARPNGTDTHSNGPKLVVALSLAALGWPVLPVHTPVLGDNGAPPNCSCSKADCGHIGKHPRTAHGRSDATPDPAVIRRWWTDWPDANIGIATGPESGVVALDEDPRHGGDATLRDLEAAHGTLPATVMAHTGGGGRHLLFKHPGRCIKSRTIAQGLDCKGNGGYIVVAPSLHASGRHYAWAPSFGPDEVRLADAPEWLLALMEAGAEGGSPRASTVEGLIPDGQRNGTLTSLAGSMRHRGMSQAAITEALKVENRERCSPPLPESEVESIARSVGRYPSASPEVPQEWELPLPLFGGPMPPPFPVTGALPPALASISEYITGLAEELQVPLDLPGMLAPAIASAAISQKFVIEVRHGWRENPPLWVLVLLDSGERKSATFRRLTDPVLEWEQDEAERLAPEIAADRERRKLREKDRAAVRSQAADGDEDARKRAIDLAKEAADDTPLSPPTLITTDATSEALAELMAANGERALISSPEGDIFDVMMGRYDAKARPNMGIWLSGYTGDRVTINRRGRDPLHLKSPTLSVAMTVQPEAVRGLFANRAAHGKGLLARFFVAAPVGMVGRRRVNAPAVPEHLEMAYVGVIRRLLNIPLDPAGGPRIVRLSVGAAAMFLEFEVAVEKELARGGCLGDRRAWGAKLCGGTARIALALHCMEAFGSAVPRTGDSALLVSPETMKAALAWAPYLIEQERLAASLAGLQPEAVVADRVLTWLQRSGAASFSQRDCFSENRGLFVGQADDMLPPLDLLVELGYIRPVPPPETRSRGRPASPVFEVNPLWDRGAAR